MVNPITRVSAVNDTATSTSAAANTAVPTVTRITVAQIPGQPSAKGVSASVIVVEENFDIGGRGMLSGGRVQLGGGHALQQKFNIKDDADKVFADWVRHDHGESRLSDRDLVRVFADENVPTFNFLIENGVEFIEKPITPPDASTVDRIFVTKEWHIPSEVIAPHRGRKRSRRMDDQRALDVNRVEALLQRFRRSQRPCLRLRRQHPRLHRPRGWQA